MNRLLFILICPFILGSCIGKYDSEAQQAGISDAAVLPNRKALDTVKVDLTKSSMHWKGTKMRGSGKHEGIIQLKEAYFLSKEEQLVGGSFTADMQTISVTDIPEHEPIPIRNLNNHLKSADFFDVEKYPNATFEIIELKRHTTDSLKVTGNLTMKGITKEVVFEAFEQKPIFSTKFTFDRFEWDIAYSGNWTDQTLVDRKVELTILLILE